MPYARDQKAVDGRHGYGAADRELACSTTSTSSPLIRGNNCEGRDWNEDQLKPEEEWNAEEDRRNRVVERDPERQNTGDNQKNELHFSP
jgi:hypothetical protein